MAFRQGRPDRITPEASGTEPFTFARHVQPILTAKCAGCHVKEKKGPQKLADTSLVQFKGGRNKRGHASAAYADLRPYAFFYAMGGGYGIKNNRSVAGKIGAHAAKLKPCLGPKHYDVKLTAKQRRLITLWMDLLSPYYCSIYDRDKQHAGEVIHPRYPSFDASNFFGAFAYANRGTAYSCTGNVDAAIADFTGEQEQQRLEYLANRCYDGGESG
jgi:hypothetical protein